MAHYDKHDICQGATRLPHIPGNEASSKATKGETRRIKLYRHQIKKFFVQESHRYVGPVLVSIPCHIGMATPRQLVTAYRGFARNSTLCDIRDWTRENLD